VWRRETVQHQGKHYTIPLPPDRGTGLGKPLKLINQPVRERIPILVAALGPKNVELAAEIAEGWQPIFYLPEKARDVWGASLAAGRATRDPALGELDIYAGPVLAIGENVESLREFVKPHLALYIGGMGAKGKNFYHALATKYGYGPQADRIQELYLAGDKDGAAKVVPDDLVRDVNLIGTRGFVKERLAAFREAGVTTLNVAPMASTAAERIKLIETLRQLV
jgi:F420-dependent oxidoreductase-like protein